MKSYIVVTGAVAAGATTLSERLAKQWGAETLLEEQIEASNPFFERFQNDPERWALANQTHFILASVDRHNKLRTMLESPLGSSVVIEDRTPFEHTGAYVEALSGAGLMPADEVELLRTVTRRLEVHYVVPSLLIYREMSDEQLSARVASRARAGEDMDFERLKGVHSAFEQFIDGWNRSPVVRIPHDIDVLDPDGLEQASKLISASWTVPNTTADRG